MSEPLRLTFPFHKVEEGAQGGTSWYRWRVGVRFQDSSAEDLDAVADGEGQCVIVEVGRYTPPGYRERVFYTRQFIAPDGTEWTAKFRVIAAAGFTRLCQGYRYPYDITDSRANVAMEPPDFDLTGVDDES